LEFRLELADIAFNPHYFGAEIDKSLRFAFNSLVNLVVELFEMFNYLLLKAFGIYTPFFDYA
jgi:hypothetical protein